MTDWQERGFASPFHGVGSRGTTAVRVVTGVLAIDNRFDRRMPAAAPLH